MKFLRRLSIALFLAAIGNGTGDQPHLSFEATALAANEGHTGRTEQAPRPTTRPEPSPSASPSPGDPDLAVKFIPLPIYATLPNEGSTWGILPVLLFVDPLTQRTSSILAPSYSWNAVIRHTTTFRLFTYPNDNDSITVTASVSSRVNRGMLFIYSHRPTEPGQFTSETFFRLQRSIFFRFFGIGNETSAANETSLTRSRADVSYRHGYNLLPFFNLGASLQIQRDLPERVAAPGLLLAQDTFPTAPGMSGATILKEGMSLRYDTRPSADYSDQGVYSEVFAGAVQGLSNSPAYGKLSFESRALIPESFSLIGQPSTSELKLVQGAARIYAGYTSSPNAPFYYQESLGGSFLLRGFTEDRFIDQGVWEVELEQRIRLFQTHIYGVVTDWRLDPFLAVGRVFHDGGSVFSSPQVAWGLGFRAFVRPNVLGRVDIGQAGEGFKFYVELGYPF